MAFRNEDDGSLVLVVTNSSRRARRLSVGQGQQVLRYTLPARSLATFVWTPEAP